MTGRFSPNRTSEVFVCQRCGAIIGTGGFGVLSKKGSDPDCMGELTPIPDAEAFEMLREAHNAKVG